MNGADNTKGHAESVHNRVMLEFNHGGIMAKMPQMAREVVNYLRNLLKLLRIKLHQST